MFMKKGTDWSREETIIAFYVYCIVPFSKSSKKNSVIIHYANILGRTPSALHMKISNIGRLDPELKEKNITGLTHGSKIEEDVWNEFESDRESLVLEAEKIIERMSKKTLEDAYLNVYEKKYTGEEKERLVRMRVNQNFFRSSIWIGSRVIVDQFRFVNASKQGPGRVDTIRRILDGIYSGSQLRSRA